MLSETSVFVAADAPASKNRLNTTPLERITGRKYNPLKKVLPKNLPFNSNAKTILTIKINGRDMSIFENADIRLKFEVNFGAVACGYRSEPYPDSRLLEKLRAAHAKLVKTSDCHDKAKLLFGLQ